MWLVSHVLQLSFDALLDANDRPVPARLAQRVDTLAGRRIERREPLAYVLNEAWLAGRRFRVNRRVIVPRSFIADLLEDCFSPWIRTPSRVRTVLDMCTGSGCLAVLAALAFPRAKVDAVDCSGHALAVARRNIACYRLGARVAPIRSDAFDALSGKRYDLIIANPPYVRDRSMQALPAEYRAEPELALASGADGLDFTRRLLTTAAEHLRPDGILVVEIGHNRRALERAFPKLPFIWLDTSAGDDYVFLLSRAALVEGRPT